MKNINLVLPILFLITSSCTSLIESPDKKFSHFPKIIKTETGFQLNYFCPTNGSSFIGSNHSYDVKKSLTSNELERSYFDVTTIGLFCMAIKRAPKFVPDFKVTVADKETYVSSTYMDYLAVSDVKSGKSKVHKETVSCLNGLSLVKNYSPKEGLIKLNEYNENKKRLLKKELERLKKGEGKMKTGMLSAQSIGSFCYKDYFKK